MNRFKIALLKRGIRLTDTKTGDVSDFKNSELETTFACTLQVCGFMQDARWEIVKDLKRQMREQKKKK